MTFSIDSKHRLLLNGKLVERVISPYTGGKFKNPPSHTVIHYTYGGSAASSAEWFRSSKNPYKSSAHLVIGRDGSVIQCVDFDTAANHAGKSFWRGRSGLNSWSFGIELANWGYLQRQANAWVSNNGHAVLNPVIAAHKNGNPDRTKTPIGWEPYTAEQLASAAAVVRTLIASFGPQEILGHDDVSVGRKWDPGPAFDMAKFKIMAADDNSDEDAGLLRIWTPGDTLNLRAGPGTEFDTLTALDHGTTLEPIEFRDHWVMVNVLNEKMQATRTGWVNSRHLR